MARNYGKRTRRYAVGGIVPKEADDDVEYEAKKYNYEREREQELPQYRHRGIDTVPEDAGPADVHPDDYLMPEERDI